MTNTPQGGVRPGAGRPVKPNKKVAITPRLECLRNNGVATRYSNNEVWAETIIKDVTGFPQGSLYTDGLATPIAASAVQDVGVGTGSWTIGSSDSPVSFKCDSGSARTPTEAGVVAMRLAVGLTSLLGTLFVDPFIRT